MPKLPDLHIKALLKIYDTPITTEELLDFLYVYETPNDIFRSVQPNLKSLIKCIVCYQDLVLLNLVVLDDNFCVTINPLAEEKYIYYGLEDLFHSFMRNEMNAYMHDQCQQTLQEEENY
jgi:hypothetical protein